MGVDYDRHARHYRAGREVPLVVTWFDAAVIALEPSSGMRAVGTEIGLPPRACYLAATAA